MDPVPLVPEHNRNVCGDITHLVREEFQDISGEKQFPVEVLANLIKNILQRKELTHFARVLKEDGSKVHNKIQELSETEKVILKSQVNIVIRDSQRSNGDALSNNQLYSEIGQSITAKYALVKGNFESATQKNTDFIDGTLVLFKNDICSSRSTSSTLVSVKQKKYSCKHKYQNSETESYRELQAKEKAKEIVLVADPIEITIKNYKTHVLYEEYFILRNITSRTQSFFTPIVTQPSNFTVRSMSSTQNIAPGMCANFLVTFVTNKFMDTTEELEINVPGGQNVIVRLTSIRFPPKLKGVVYYDLDDVGSVKLEQQEKDFVFNKTVDCGTCLLGSNAVVKFVIKNVGGDGSFFFMSEDDFVFYHVIDVTEKFKLYMNEFTISPVYIELNTHETKELTITYNPIECGLGVDRFCILCDNDTLQEIDIIGDCLMFTLDSFKFEFGKLKGEAIKGPAFCNCLSFGHIYNHCVLEHSFVVFNNSSLRIEYAWKIDEIEPEPDIGVFSLKKDWINIYPQSGCFEQYRKKEFTVQILMDAAIGAYSCSLSFYALNIPQESLPDNVVATLNDGIHTKSDLNANSWNIQVEQFQILVYNLPIDVEINPKEVELKSLKFNVASPHELIHVSNDGDIVLNFEWKCLKMSSNIRTTFDPVKFSLPVNTSLFCTLKVTPLTYEEFDETYILLVNDKRENLELRVKGTVKKPVITVKNTLLDFGIVRKESYKSLQIPIVNKHKMELEWNAFEFNFDFDTQSFTEIKETNLSQNCGKLNRLEKFHGLMYRLDTTIPRKHFSVVVFYTSHNSVKEQSKHVLVTADIMEPLIKITDVNYSQNIFNIQDVYTVKDELTLQIYLNNESLVKTTYRWAVPVGIHKDMLKIKFDCERGKLSKFCRKSTQLTINFLQAGFVHDFHIPCIVDGLEEPVYLQICCRVKEIQYIVSIPAMDKYLDIYWPDAEETDSENSTVEENERNSLVNNSENKSKDLQENKKSEAQFGKATKDNNTPDDYYYSKSENDLYRVQEVKKYIEEHKSEFAIEVRLSHLASSTALTEFNKSKSVITVKSDSVSTTSDSASNMSQYMIEYMNIPCREAHKKTIYITNPSKHSAAFKLFMAYFCETQNEIVRTSSHQALMKLKYKPNVRTQHLSDKLSVYGIVVAPTPNCGYIAGEQCCKIDIWVYAETWGYYCEEISIDIEKLPTLYLNLVIKIVGQPVVYPIIISTDEQHPVINFGTLAYALDAKPLKRIVKIHNSSTIPYVIVWHLLTKKLDNSSQNPINVLLDLFSFESDDDELNCKVRITQYFGDEIFGKDSYFQIEPKESFFEPQETREVSITFTPPFPSDNFEVMKIEAQILGHVYIEEDDSHCSKIMKRDPVRDLQPTKIYLTAKLECPELDFKHVRGKTIVSLSVEDILHNIKTEETLCLLFKNNNSSCAKVRVLTEKPFEIISAKTMHSTQTEGKAIEVYHGECLKITVKCWFSCKFVMELADAFYGIENHNLEDITKLENNCLCITRPLNIYQACGVKQSLDLKTKLMFPAIDVSTSLINFEEVCVGRKEFVTIRLLNKTNMETKFKVSLTSKCVFAVEPNFGYLKPKMLHDKAVYLTVYFRPQNALLYEDILLIETCLPQYKCKVQLIGEGICDDTYYDTDIIQE